MKLSEKDKLFIERLKELVDEQKLWIDYAKRSPAHFVLRGNYGEHVEKKFGMTRQGVRWRFWRLFNDIYIAAYTTILFVERHFGPELRKTAMEIARERFRERQDLLQDPYNKEANPYRHENQD